MTASDRIAATRASYDALAEPYTSHVRDLMAQSAYDRAVLALFTELVTAGGGGPVLDVGCGPGRVAAHLTAAGLDVTGVDLSPAMVAIARRQYPHVRFVTGSMTDLDAAGSDDGERLDLPDGGLGGVVAWYSVIHVPDDLLPGVLARFARAVRTGGILLLAFQTGEEVVHREVSRLGPQVDLDFHRRPAAAVAALAGAAGFGLLMSAERTPLSEEGAETGQCYLLAQRLD